MIQQSFPAENNVQEHFVLILVWTENKKYADLRLIRARAV